MEKDRTVRVRVTRDSVCLGDDMHSPHERFIRVSIGLNPLEFARVLAAEYLPTMSDLNYRWQCFLDGVLIAELRANTEESKVPAIVYESQAHVHIKYFSRSCVEG